MPRKPGTREQVLVDAVAATGEALASLKVALAEWRDESLTPAERQNAVRAWTTRARRLLIKAEHLVSEGIP